MAERVNHTFEVKRTYTVNIKTIRLRFLDELIKKLDLGVKIDDLIEMIVDYFEQDDGPAVIYCWLIPVVDLDGPKFYWSTEYDSSCAKLFEIHSHEFSVAAHSQTIIEQV
jgi:hypothetical protein